MFLKSCNKALAFNRDWCCYLALCLWLILFHCIGTLSNVSVGLLLFDQKSWHFNFFVLFGLREITNFKYLSMVIFCQKHQLICKSIKTNERLDNITRKMLECLKYFGKTCYKFKLWVNSKK
jgi:hypothetical protein